MRQRVTENVRERHREGDEDALFPREAICVARYPICSRWGAKEEEEEGDDGEGNGN